VTGTEHKITIRYVKARCGDPGHYDEVAECSCGEFKAVNTHQSDNARLASAMTGHRLAVIESLLAIRLSIEHKGYNDGER